MASIGETAGMRVGKKTKKRSAHCEMFGYWTSMSKRSVSHAFGPGEIKNEKKRKTEKKRTSLNSIDHRSALTEIGLDC